MYELFVEETDDDVAEENARLVLEEYETGPTLRFFLVLVAGEAERMPKKRFTKDCFCVVCRWGKVGSQEGRRS